MRNWNVGYIGAAALIAVVGCSTSTKKIDRADQKQIYQDYRMEYDTNSNKTTAVAQFREGGQSGETLRLVAPAAVGDAAMDLTEKNELGTKYTAQKQGFVKNHAWTFTDFNGKTYSNTFAIAEAKIPNNLPARQAVDKAFTLAWEGEPIADDKDTVTLLVADTGAVGAVKPADRISVRKAGAKQIEIPVDKVQKYGEGEREIRLERKRTLSLKQATDAGGHAETIYTSAPLKITFFVDKTKVQPKKDDKKKDDKKAEPKKDDKKAPAKG